jgi:hypothetical protein
MIEANVEAILLDGMHSLHDRATGLINLLLTIEHVLAEDGNVSDLIMEAVIHAYPHTEHHDNCLQSLIAEVRKRAKRELIKAGRGRR